MNSGAIEPGSQVSLASYPGLPRTTRLGSPCLRVTAVFVAITSEVRGPRNKTSIPGSTPLASFVAQQGLFARLLYTEPCPTACTTYPHETLW